MASDHLIRLAFQPPTCSPADPCAKPANCFRQDPGLQAVPVLEGTRPVALLARGEFLALWAGRYSYSLLHDRLLGEWLKTVVHRGLPTINHDEDLAAAARAFRHCPSTDHCLVVVQGGEYRGLLSRQAVMEGLLEQAQTQALDLAVARDAAIESDRAKSIFLATISHEIRTPLTGILGCSEILHHDITDPDLRELAEAIVGSGRTLLALLNDLIDTARLEGGRVVLDPQPFDLHECLEDLVRLLGTPARAKGLSVEILLDPALPRTVVGDQVRVRQIIANLLGNAVKFTSTGTVRLRAGPLEDGTEIQVIDTGPGIPEEALSRLFTPFSQADSGLTRRHGGAGLGLSICRQLADLMGGSIDVQSLQGQGSIFTLQLPLLPPPAPGHSSRPRTPITASIPRSMESTR